MNTAAGTCTTNLAPIRIQQSQDNDESCTVPVGRGSDLVLT
jgi:hypothetical protein